MEINTNNFIKFICTLSITAAVACIYFGEVYLDRYNIKSTELNIRKAQLRAELFYLMGIRNDLALLIGDTLSNIKEPQYSYSPQKDTIRKAYYYRSVNLPIEKKILVDSLNRVNRNYGEIELEISAIEETHCALEKNIRIEYIFLWIIGALSSAAFLISLYEWYKGKDIVDKQNKKSHRGSSSAATR